LQDKGLRNLLSENGLKTCRQFEWRKILEKIDNIYKTRG